MIGGNVRSQIEKDENVKHCIRRHPIGLLTIYTFVFVSVLFMIIMFSIFIGSSDSALEDIPDWVLGLILILAIIFVVGVGIIGRLVYWTNELYVTDENVIQILRPNLLNQSVSQLNLAKIQDVSVKQNGAMQMAFHYGTVIIETAGEVASYSFDYCPQPNDVAAKIMLAHDEYIAKHGISKNALSAP